jgi:hypothetical protein
MEDNESSTDIGGHDPEGTPVVKSVDLIRQKFQMIWLYPLLEDVSTRLVRFMDDKAAMPNEEGYEANELARRFTLNNMGSCGFEGKYFEEKNSYFRQIAREFFLPEP